ncbi:hypothetical protein DFH28DRAFT_891373 [Melampsora americana]|nr:hypothetical protein DFH28DRAFT_891373 [Melampsora americana]
MMVKIAFVWGYLKADSINLKDQARMYLEGIEPFNLSKKFLLALDYWHTLPASLTTNQINLFAIKLLEPVPHAGGVESLFTHMAATKNKSSNQMTPSHLMMILQVKLSLAHNSKKIKSKSKNKNTNNPKIKIVDLKKHQELEPWVVCFEGGVFPQQEKSNQILSRLDPNLFDDMIGDLFDLTTFVPNSLHSVKSAHSGEAFVDTTAAVWNLEDLF